ncbi:MAG: hypothetical protein JO256_04780, partial [Alphaproteobacteria bacterium]|nr:hypothetical protein [Alphaproteobacteria bacterium]
MTLDTLLSQPLAPVSDDGFSARIVLQLRRAEECRRWLLWAAAILALMPLLVLFLPTAQLAVSQMSRWASAPFVAYPAGAL